MKIQHNKSYYLFLMLFVSLTIVFGCGERDKQRIQTEKFEYKQLQQMEAFDQDLFDQDLLLCLNYDCQGHTDSHELKLCRVSTLSHKAGISSPEKAQYVSPTWHKELSRAFYLVFK